MQVVDGFERQPVIFEGLILREEQACPGRHHRSLTREEPATVLRIATRIVESGVVDGETG